MEVLINQKRLRKPALINNILENWIKILILKAIRGKKSEGKIKSYQELETEQRDFLELTFDCDFCYSFLFGSRGISVSNCSIPNSTSLMGNLMGQKSGSGQCVRLKETKTQETRNVLAWSREVKDGEEKHGELNEQGRRGGSDVDFIMKQLGIMVGSPSVR